MENIPYAITNQPWLVKHILSYSNYHQKIHSKKYSKVFLNLEKLRVIRKKLVYDIIEQDFDGVGYIYTIITLTPHSIIGADMVHDKYVDYKCLDNYKTGNIFTNKIMNKFNSKYQKWYKNDTIQHLLLKEKVYDEWSNIFEQTIDDVESYL